MFKKTIVMIVVLTIAVIFVVPINADPADVVLDQQVTLAVPGSFELLDQNNDGRPETVKVRVKINNYREGKFIVTGKLEARLDEGWTEIDRAQLLFNWSPTADTVEVSFSPALLRKDRVSGPYRASVALQDGEWQLPMQVVGVSP